MACHDLPELNAIESQMPHQQSLINPYVKLRILPDNQHRVKTRVLKGTRNPIYDETFTLYGITETNIQNYSLHLAVSFSIKLNFKNSLKGIMMNLFNTKIEFFQFQGIFHRNFKNLIY